MRVTYSEPKWSKAGLLAGLLILLQSCMTAPQSGGLKVSVSQLPMRHEIPQVPFFAQEQFYCGPTTIAEVLNYFGHEIQPEQVAPSLFIPERDGSLQIEMVASIRQYGLLPYAQHGDLMQLLSLVSEGLPIIVLQNLGTSWYPRWHYALVIGYDLQEREVILHTGVNRRRHVAMELFENTWRRSDYWLLAAVPPEHSSEHLDAFVYTRAAQDLLEVGRSDAGTVALQTATERWPDYWLPYFLLGNHFLQPQPAAALAWFRQGLHAGQEESAYLNNYAYALLYNDVPDQALVTINRALRLNPDDPNLRDSLAEIRAAGEN